MKYKALINIMPHKELLDPQGKAVTAGLHNIGLAEVDNVRIGKRIELDIEAADEATAKAKVEEACKKLLANQIMEGYQVQVQPA